jgi:ketosteroid isomerase-like protein
MNQSERVDVIKGIFAAFIERGDVEPLLAASTEDVTIRLTVLPGTPLSGEFKGKDGVRTYFVRNAETVESTDFTVTNYLVGGDQIGVVGTEALKVLRSGETHAGLHWVVLFAFRGDKIESVLVVEDTAPISSAYRR